MKIGSLRIIDHHQADESEESTIRRIRRTTGMEAR
jgi:hypothetical protein